MIFISKLIVRSYLDENKRTQQFQKFEVNNNVKFIQYYIMLFKKKINVSVNMINWHLMGQKTRKCYKIDFYNTKSGSKLFFSLMKNLMYIKMKLIQSGMK